MIGSLLGMTVVREIAGPMLLGLATGQYTLHGGVIRWAAGTPQAGQIISHLVPVPGASSNSAFSGLGMFGNVTKLASQIPLVTGTLPLGGVLGAVVGGIAMVNTFKLLKIAKRTMALSEMNLAVSRAGFSSLERRLNQLEAKLDEVKTSITSVLTFMKMEQRAELRISLDHLNRIDLITDPHVRRELLVTSAATLGKIGLIYEQRLGEAVTLSVAMISEEYYCIAMLAQARCYAELRELAMARRILETTYHRWCRLARQIMTHHLFAANPERFLASDFARLVPIVELAEWLDFAYDQVQGLAWIDELRAKGDPWYYYKDLAGQPNSRRMGRPQERTEIVELHTTLIIPAIQKLVARNSVFETYIAQYELMEQHQLTAIEFEQLLSSVAIEDQIEGFIILEPAVQVRG